MIDLHELAQMYSIYSMSGTDYGCEDEAVDVDFEPSCHHRQAYILIMMIKN